MIVDWKDSHTLPPQPTAHSTHLKFEISDTGPGIAADDLDPIFETFGRAGQNDRAIEGTGLGLALSRQFAHLLGGNIRVASETGTGSVFTFSLPTEVVPAPADARPHTAARRIVGFASDQPPCRILIVEDSPDSREFLCQLLRSVGFLVDEAHNGQEAIEHWQQQRPDLIFMDMRMPVMDGYEATREIRRLEAKKVRGVDGEQAAHNDQTPIIALTASVFEEERLHILEAGCQHVLRKPAQEQDIFDMLQASLGVEYLYQDEPDPRTPNASLERGLLPLTPDMLAALPPDVVTTLERAAAQVSVKQVDAAIQSVRRHNAPTADALAHLARDFKYQEIWKMIQQVKP